MDYGHHELKGVGSSSSCFSLDFSFLSNFYVFMAFWEYKTTRRGRTTCGVKCMQSFLKFLCKHTHPYPFCGVSCRYAKRHSEAHHVKGNVWCHYERMLNR